MPAIVSNLRQSRYDFAFDALRKLAPDLPSRVVFDIGAGDGRMKRIEALDLTWRGYDQTGWANRSRGIEVTSWDLSSPCPAGQPQPGAVLLLDVLEHCLNPGAALKHIGAVLPSGGRLILTMPNPRWSASRLHTIVFGCPSGFTQHDLDTNHHVFTPWPHIIVKMLGDSGFATEEYATLDGRTQLFRHALSPKYPVQCVADLVRTVIERIDRTACGMGYGLIARRTESVPV